MILRIEAGNTLYCSPVTDSEADFITSPNNGMKCRFEKLGVDHIVLGPIDNDGRLPPSLYLIIPETKIEEFESFTKKYEEVVQKGYENLSNRQRMEIFGNLMLIVRGVSLVDTNLEPFS